MPQALLRLNSPALAKGFDEKYQVLPENPHARTLSSGASGLAQINLMMLQLALAADAEDKSYSKLEL